VASPGVAADGGDDGVDWLPSGGTEPAGAAGAAGAAGNGGSPFFARAAFSRPR
jgi:hypothetical protein